MTSTNHVNPNPDALQLDMQVLVSEEDKSVYVKISGFDDINEADKYAEYLTEVLPLMLFESEVKH
jgi:hypothetical protein